MSKTAEVKDLAYYKANAEEDYSQVPISVLRYISQLEQAKELEKEQIINAYDYMRCIGNFESGEQYYNETFKNK